MQTQQTETKNYAELAASYHKTGTKTPQVSEHSSFFFITTVTPSSIN